MNIYDALNLAEDNGHRASLQSDGRWFLIRKADRAIVNIGYSIIEAVSVLVQPEPVAEVVEEVVEVVAELVAEVVAEPVAPALPINVVSDSDYLTFEEAVEILHHVRGDHVSEEMIDEARGLIIRAVSVELRARGVGYVDDNIGDWVACTTFDGTETTESLAREFCEENSLPFTNWTEINNSYALYDERDTMEYSAWLKQQEVA